MDALKGFAWLLAAQSLGEGIARITHAPLPGPVIGLVIMLLALNFALVRAPVQAAAEALLTHLSLLFVPVGVGVMVHTGLIAEYGVRMLVAIVLATWIGLAVTALVLRALTPGEKG
jgi:holin-like protein